MKLFRLIPVMLLGASPVAAAGADSVLNIPRTSRPPRLADFLEMSQAGETSLARVRGFIQRTPRDGDESTERTDVYVSYDDTKLYVIFVCFDDDPAEIRARMVARGVQILDDDFVSIQIDTFRDQRRAYAFSANPLGIQNTGVWIEGQGWDYSFDTVWHSKGQRTERGYVVWMSIPFRSLRFSPASRQTWGLMLQRNIPRNNEESYWPSYSSRIEGRLNQAGQVTGIENVSPGRNVQLIPYAYYRSFRALDASDPGRPHFTSDAAESRLGLDAKFVLKDSIVVDATVNPDFSQVESDEPQVTVNQRFEVFFPEKRPFFLENASFFQTPINLVFTRRIQDPSVGLRMTGKVGPYAMGALMTGDRSPGPLSDEGALFGVFRLSRDIGSQSNVGAIYTDREFGQSSNRVAGVDGRFKLSQNWTATFQAATSATKPLDGASLNGPAYEATLARAGRQFNYNLTYRDRSPGFRTFIGFDPRPDIRSLDQLAGYRFRPEGERFLSWGPDFKVVRTTDHEGIELELSYGPAIHWEWTRQTRLGVYYLDINETLRPQDFPGLMTNERFSQSIAGLMFSTAFIPEVNFNAHVVAGTGINFQPPAGDTPTLENLSSADLGIVLRPMTSLTLDTRYLLTRLTARDDGGNVFNNHIVQSKVNYQITRALSVRAILQYNAVLANAARTSLSTTKSVNADFLFTYFLHHGTALYVGYNGNLQNIDPRLQTTASGLARTRNVFMNDASQFFVKFSYLVRF